MIKTVSMRYLYQFLYHNQRPKEIVKELSPKEAAKAIADIFVNRNVRMKGHLPSEEEYVEMQSRLELTTKTGEPISAVVQFGGSKTFRYCPYPEPDLAELMALEQLVRINNKIRAIYKPGFKIRLLIADTYYSYVYGYDETVERYRSGMENLIKELDLTVNHNIIPIRYSSLVKAFGEDKIKKRCEENCRLLQEYWDTGTQKSFQNLIEAGWKGTLPEEQKQHCMEKSERILAKKGFGKEVIEDEKKASSIRFLAYALMTAQFDLLGRKDKKVIDVSFLPLMPGEPKT